MKEKCTIAAAILAGGKASRLGGLAKGTLDIAGGQTIIDRLVRELTQGGAEEIIISANDATPYGRYGKRIVADITKGAGPVGGIEAALVHLGGRCDAVIFVPCDMPAITAREISKLKEAFLAGETPVVYAETGDYFWQPLCAVVHNGLADKVSAAIRDGVRSVRDLWCRLGAATVHFENDAAFMNVNSPADLDAWRALNEEIES